MRIFEQARPIGLLLAATAIASFLSPPDAHAQDAPTSGQRLDVVRFDIPRQPLASALAAFARQSGSKLAYGSALSQGRIAPPLQGGFTIPQALDRLLAGTGLIYRFSGPGTLTIERRPQESVPAGSADGEALPVIDVGASAGGGLYAPNHGFVEKRTLTGSKTDTPLVEVPQSISVVTRGELDARKAVTDSMALLYSPGVFAQPFGANLDQWNPFYMIRGFMSAFGGSYVDNLVSPVNYRYEPYGYDRYDVLRGPSSTLYGQSDPGGLVNRITKRPQAQSGGELEFQYGNYDRKNIAGDITGPLDEQGTLLYRLTFLYRNANSAVDYANGQKIPDNRLYVAPAITWNITPETSLTVLGSALADDVGQTAVYVTPDRFATRIRLDRPGADDFSYKQHFIGYAFEHKFDTSLIFRQRFRYSFMDYDYKSLAQYDIATPPTDGVTYVYPYGFSEERNDFVLDNNLQKQLTIGPAEHMILLGFDYQHLRDRVRFLSNYDSAIPFFIYAPDYSRYDPTLNVDADTTAISDNYGLYLQDQMKLDEHWVLTLGGRFDWAASRLTGFSYGEDAADKSRDSAFSWRSGLTYLADNGLAPYFSYAKSFLPTSGRDGVTGQIFKPTIGEQYEVGVKFQPLGERSLFAFAAYDLTKQNVVTTGQLLGGEVYSTQRGAVKARGLEFEANAHLTDSIKLHGAYTYTVAKIVAALDGSVGETPAQVPRHMGSLWVDYDLPIDTIFGGVSVGGGVRHIGSNSAWNTNAIYFPDEGPRFKNNAYTLFDAAVRYDLGRLSPDLAGASFTVNAANIFDHRYQACFTRFTCSPGVPMTIIGSVRYRW